MKKVIIISVLVILSITILFQCANSKPDYNDEILVEKIFSPDENTVLNIYQGPMSDSVMVDVYVVGEICFIRQPSVLSTKKVVYYRYHDELDEAYWIDNENLVLNGTTINIYNSETWRIE